jgi:hypothetical protein
VMFIWEKWSDSVWVNVTRTTSTYDNPNRFLSEVDENWSNNVWVNDHRITDTYDNPGNLIFELYETWSNNTWINYNLTSSDYDNSGNLLASLNKNWINNVWIDSSQVSYTYDNNGNCTHGESLIWQNSSWVKQAITLSLSYNLHQDYLYVTAAVADVEYTIPTGIASNQLNTLSFNLQQNYPNPFNPSTTINYSLAKEGHVRLTIYNTIGSQVATIVNETKPAGNYSIQFNGNKLASGIYLYRLETDNYSAVKKLILLK